MVVLCHELINFIKHEIEGVRRAYFSPKHQHPEGNNCDPLYDVIFFCSHEVEFIQNIMKDKIVAENEAFNLTFMYAVDVMSINNPNFADWIPLPVINITPKELK